jgi:hypothetical protein
MDLLTQKSGWKNVKIDVVLGKTLGPRRVFSPGHNTWKQSSCRE